MRNWTNLQRVGLLVVMILGIGTAGLLHAAEAQSPVANLEVTSAEISLTPVVKAAGSVLTISGPDGIYLTRSLAAGAAASISLIDPELGRLEDGAYTYQLVLEPVIDDATRKAMTTARAQGDDAILQRLRSEGKLPQTPMIQSGSFMVRNGSFVTTAQEEAPTKDIVHADDVIINGGSSSLCVGYDCINGESFGYDTVRLKENSVRIHLDDTSIAAGFPANDWRIVANDSTSGGGNYLAFEDSTAGRIPFRVEAGAPAHSLYVDDYGRVGLGTSTPYTEIHSVDGDTPTVRLQQDGSSGFAAQSWDLAGNETNFFVRDVTSGSTLPFRIQPGAPTSSIHIKSTGDVGLGTSAPSGSLEISRSTGAAADMLVLTNNAPTRIYMNNTASASDWRFNSANNGNFRIADGDSNIELELEPNGDLTISGTLTTAGSTYPDYVFESGYELMSLDELNDFVASNRHLPNVPKADAVDGGQRINMTELQITMLEKIEELTLYTLEQHETIKELRSSLAEMKDRMAILEATK